MSKARSTIVMTTVTMAVVLILVLGSTAGNMNAKKAGDDGVNNPDRCLQAGKDDGRDSGISQSEFDTKLVNQDLSICLDLISYRSNNTSIVCHPIKEGDIPQTNDSIVDAGYLVIPDKLNQTAIMACTHIGYREESIEVACSM